MKNSTDKDVLKKLETIFEEVAEPTAEELDKMMSDMGEDESDLYDYDETESESYEDDEAFSGSIKQEFDKRIREIRLLTPAEEVELGKIIKAGGKDALAARNKLVESNLRLVLHCAKRYCKNIDGNSKFDRDDIFEMGNIGLIKAAEKYDYTLGYRFSTYATWWINQAIMRDISQNKSEVRIPVHMLETINKINKFKDSYVKEYGEEPSVEEIALETKIDIKRIEEVSKYNYNVVSINKKMGEDEDTEFGELIADMNAADPCEAAIHESLKEKLQYILSQLTPKEARVLSLRYGLENGEPMTLEEIANLPEFDVTRERIRQIENKAIRRIRYSVSMRKLIIDYAV